MDKKKLLLLAAALLIAVGTAFGARTLFMGGGAPDANAATAQEQLPMVLVAKQALPVGTIITADMLTMQPWPKELLREAYFVQTPNTPVDLASMNGRVVRFGVTAGEPVTQGALVAPGDRGFLAAALSPGMRAVTIPVSGPTAVGGFVFPGDRIDLVLTQKIDGVDGPELKASETIVRNLRVLATNQSTEATKDEAGKTIAQADISLITVEATPRIAEKITVAQSIGTVSISLRSLSDSEGDIDAALASGEIKIPEGLSPTEERAYLARMQSKPADGKPTYVTGGDVSRFQRSTVPAQTKAKESAPAPRAEPVRITASPAQSSPVKQEPEKPKGPVVRISGGREAVIEF